MGENSDRKLSVANFWNRAMAMGMEKRMDLTNITELRGQNLAIHSIES